MSLLPIPDPNSPNLPATTRDGNDSGLGQYSHLPEELRGLNWGAFLLNWVWSIAHGTWIGLLCFVPYFGLAVPFVLLFKGNEWAWKNRRWDSIEHYRRVQRDWRQWGIVLPVILLVFLWCSFIIYARHVGGQIP